MEPTLKERLVELVNTYVDARLTNNVKLIQFASRDLQEFLERVELSEVKSVEPEVLANE